MEKIYNIRIKELRNEFELTQKEIANKIGYSTYNYQRYEYGQTPISIDALIKLAAIYHTSTDYILGLTERRAPYPKI